MTASKPVDDKVTIAFLPWYGYWYCDRAYRSRLLSLSKALCFNIIAIRLAWALAETAGCSLVVI